MHQECERAEEAKRGEGVMDGRMDLIQRQISKIAQINCASKVLILAF